MEKNKAFIIRGNNVIGMDVQKVYTSTPVGIIQPFASNTNIPRGYLLCDGASYKVAEYPDLYAVIGNTYGGDSTNFNVPDYRETVLVGVGENTTDTIASHDVYELGEFKDDQLQTHTHKVKWHATSNSGSTSWIGSGGGNYPEDSYEPTSPARTGTTTHGKQKGVTYIIKAFHTNEGTDSGVSDDVVEYVEGEIATKLDKGYITGITDANNAIGENGVNIFVMSASSSNMPLSRTGIIRSYTTIEDKYIRVNQEYSTIDNAPQIGGTYKRYGASDDGGVTFTWSNWNFVGSIDDNTTAALKTWSSSKIAEYVAENAAPSYSGTVIPTSIANGASVTTDWNIQSAGSNADYGRLLMLNSSAGTFLIYVKGNLGSASTVPTPTVISSIGNSQSASWSSSFELSISGSKLRIKNKSGAVASWRFV